MIDFSHVRPWRNRNPGDLRTLPPPEKWFGQADVDAGAGGPFAIFVSETDGWRALGMCLLVYQDVHHLRTVRAVIGRYAPALENDTGGYVGLVCHKLGVGPDDAIDIHQPATMTALVTAIALAEGGARLPWNEAAKQSGVMLALHLKQPLPIATLKPDPDLGADALNEAQLAKVASSDGPASAPAE